MRNLLNLLAFCALALTTFATCAAEKRVALVIGNSAYPSSRLDNPKNDATAIAATFRRLGFEVDLVIDASKADFDAALQRYAARADSADAAVVFYAGHGIEVSGKNYLVPIDAKPKNERDLKREMIKLDDVIDDMGNARVKLVFFDACRDNPLARSFRRGGTRGLAAPAEATGTLISFATKHGNTAEDGERKHSPYTEALIAALENPTEEVHTLLRKKVQEAVKKKTQGQQEPWAYGNLNGDFYFIQGPLNITVNPAVPAAPDPIAIELGYWNGVLQATSAEAYQSYLSRYPNGQFADIARANLTRLKVAPEAKPQGEKLQGDKPRGGNPQGEDKPATPDPAQMELSFWESIKHSGDKGSFKEYLRQWPTGRFAELASSRVKALDSEVVLPPGKLFKDCADCPEMVVIPAGRFTMGSPKKDHGPDTDESPQREVSLRSFALGKTEVTVGEFRRFMQANPGYKTEAERNIGEKGCFAWDKSDVKWDQRAGMHWDKLGFAQDDRQPVTCISWNDAQEYLKWLGKATGKEYRLPSEAEWEYAARAGTTTARYWGDDPDQACRYANVADEYPFDGHSWNDKHHCNDGRWFTAPVGSYQPNAFGLHDMLGNVWEWTEDVYGSYADAPQDGSPRTTSKDIGGRVVRGGSWLEDPGHVSATYRGGSVASNRNDNYGFRPARMLP